MSEGWRKYLTGPARIPGPGELSPVLRQVIKMSLRYNENEFLELARSPNAGTEVSEEAILRQLQLLIRAMPIPSDRVPSSVSSIIKMLNEDSMRLSSKKGLFEDALQEILKRSGYELSGGLLELCPVK
jgi:hypothetical protein